MDNGDYMECCRGCKLSQRIETPIGGIIELNGGWILNHYGGGEGFLGWLALQPKKHRMELTELTEDEAKSLGLNIIKIEKALRDYWQDRFSSDPIKRMYVVYFFESIYDEPKPTEYHLHIHLIPRTKKLAELLREYSEGRSTINAWKIYSLNKYREFPDAYLPTNENIDDLMQFLRDILT